MVVIRPRATGVRVVLLRQQIAQPLVVLSLVILAIGVARAIADPSFVAGAVSLFWFPILALTSFAYLALYYRNVSWAITDGDLVRRGVLRGQRRTPVSNIRRLVNVRVATTQSAISVVLVLGDNDRCLAQIGRSDEYLRSDLEAIARAADAPLIDGGSIDFSEYARRYPGAVSRPALVAAAINARGSHLPTILAVIIVAAFLTYEIMSRPWVPLR